MWGPDCSNLAQDRVQRWVGVNTVTGIRFPKNLLNILTS
jgi:hypothetical protein